MSGGADVGDGRRLDVDLDLLADYIGGALDGDPREAEVARLVAADPAWTRAHALLTAATEAVRADLTRWGGLPEAMPVGVARRIEGALSGAVAPGPAAARTRTRRLPRWVRWAAPTAVAAGLAGFAAFGLTSAQPPGHEAGSTGVLSDAAPSPPRPAGSLVRPGWQIETSGTDYQVGTLTSGPALSQAQPGRAASPGGGADSGRDDGLGPGQRVAVPPALDRLTDPRALSECLDSIALEAGAVPSRPISVDVVDFAQFDGTPALIVRFRAVSTGWSWVAGPRCGLPGAGADTLFRAPSG